MTIAVIPEGGEPAESESAPVVEEGPRSPLALLKGKRQALEAKLYKDLKVPRWDDVLGGRSLWVRYRPINTMLASQSAERREKSHKAAVQKGSQGDPDWPVKAQADALVNSCVAVYDLAGGDEPPEDIGDNLPTFASQELSEALGAQHNAVDTVLKLYGTNADVQLAFGELLGWSGQTSEEARQAFFGQLKGDDFVRTAAIALSVGIGDPLAFLRSAPEDWDLAVEIVRVAYEMQSERRRNELKVLIEALSKTVGNAVAKAIGQMFG